MAYFETFIFQKSIGKTKMLQQNKKNFSRAIIATIFLVVLAGVYFINIIIVSKKINGLQDFGSFIASGKFAVQGENPYSADSPLIFSVKFHKIDHQGIAPNLNPPISVLFFEQLTRIPPLFSAHAWRVLSILFYFIAFYIFFRERGEQSPSFLWRALWMFGLAGFWHTIELGQIYTLLLLLSAMIFKYTRDRKFIPAGILLGLLIAIKPNFIFWAVALLAAGYASIFIIAGITALIISLIPIYVHGIKIYEQWFEASRIFTPDLLIFPGNNSLQGLTARFHTAEAGIILSGILAILILIMISKQKPSIQTTNALAVITSLLISPIAWTGYTILLLPYIMCLKKWKAVHWIATCIFLFPFYIILTYFESSFFNFVFLGWFYGWGLLILLFNEVKGATSRNPLHNFIF